MAAPVLVFTHCFNALKGWPSPSAVDYSAKLSANVTVDPAIVAGGRVVHLNSSGEFELGVAAGTFVMPIYLIQGASEYDVLNSSPTGPHAWTPVSPTGKMSGVVAVGAYELETTEFDTTSTYYPNDLLTSPAEADITGTDKTAAGKLFKARNWPGGSTAAIIRITDTIVGLVSRPAALNPGSRVSVLSFWPYLLPGGI